MVMFYGDSKGAAKFYNDGKEWTPINLALKAPIVSGQRANHNGGIELCIDGNWVLVVDAINPVKLNHSCKIETKNDIGIEGDTMVQRNVNNDKLPPYLQGANAPGYEHNLDAYRGKDFMIELRNGGKMNVRDWVAHIQILREKESELIKARNLAPTPVDVTFYNNDTVCKVTWEDGTTTVVKWNGISLLDRETAMAMALIKKTVGLKKIHEMHSVINAFAIFNAKKEAKKVDAILREEDRKAKAYKKRIKNEVRRRNKDVQFQRDVAEAIYPVVKKAKKNTLSEPIMDMGSDCCEKGD